MDYDTQSKAWRKTPPAVLKVMGRKLRAGDRYDRAMRKKYPKFRSRTRKTKSDWRVDIISADYSKFE